MGGMDKRRILITGAAGGVGYRPQDSWADKAPADEPVVEGGAPVDDTWPKGS